MGGCYSCLGRGGDPPFYIELLNGTWQCIDRLAGAGAGIIDYIIDASACPDRPAPAPTSSYVGAWVGGILGGGALLGGLIFATRILIIRHRRRNPYQGVRGVVFQGRRIDQGIPLFPLGGNEPRVWNEGLFEGEEEEWRVRPVPVGAA